MSDPRKVYVCRKCGHSMSDLDAKFDCSNCMKIGYIERSCWLIEFEDGRKMIISEDLYKEGVERNWAGRKRIDEQHWFDYEQCRQRNRGLPCYVDLRYGKL